ncbi:Hypothetical_protein [Hexamita inflata]|uniref:Hypothetical_protein n=1 Tax=Hexamita inflata TaxID=28002 RepID=A0AA86QRF9_9EUKA|nr:Hypothetical protein HINF_LOCUS46912 [Hexamita inflata]
MQRSVKNSNQFQLLFQGSSQILVNIKMRILIQCQNERLERSSLPLFRHFRCGVEPLPAELQFQYSPEYKSLPGEKVPTGLKNRVARQLYYKQIVVQSTISGLPPAEQCKITYFVNNKVQIELTNLSSYVSFPFLLQNQLGIQNYQVQIHSTCSIEIIMIYSLIYELEHEVKATKRKTPGTYFVKKNEANTSQISIFESASDSNIAVCSIPILLRFTVSDCLFAVKQLQTAQVKTNTQIDSEHFTSEFVYYSVKSSFEDEITVNSNTVFKIRINAQIQPSDFILPV